jgi:PPOX class probable F420-dependent enzyme
VTLADDGRPRPVPIAFAFRYESGTLVLYTALDEKKKSVADPRDLARVRDIAAHARVAVLVDRWDEDWTRLAWVRLEGTATVLEPQGGAEAAASMRKPQGDAQQRPGGRPAEVKSIPSGVEHALAVGLLRQRYKQYATHNLEARPVIKVMVERVSGWSA